MTVLSPRILCATVLPTSFRSAFGQGRRVFLRPRAPQREWVPRPPHDLISLSVRSPFRSRRCPSDDQRQTNSYTASRKEDVLHLRAPGVPSSRPCDTSSQLRRDRESARSLGSRCRSLGPPDPPRPTLSCPQDFRLAGHRRHNIFGTQGVLKHHTGRMTLRRLDYILG